MAVRPGRPQSLQQWKRDDEGAGRAAEGKEHEQVWKRIVAFLHEIVRVCGDDVVPLQEFSQIVKDGLEQLKFSLIPPTLDHVTFTSVERGYTMQARVVFLCGLNDGVFPQRTSEEGMLNDAERRKLEAWRPARPGTAGFRSFQENSSLSGCRPGRRAAAPVVYSGPATTAGRWSLRRGFGR